MFLFIGHEACGILVPQPGIELEGKVLTWTAREVPRVYVLKAR